MIYAGIGNFVFRGAVKFEPGNLRQRFEYVDRKAASVARRLEARTYLCVVDVRCRSNSHAHVVIHPSAQFCFPLDGRAALGWSKSTKGMHHDSEVFRFMYFPRLDRFEEGTGKSERSRGTLAEENQSKLPQRSGIEGARGRARRGKNWTRYVRTFYVVYVRDRTCVRSGVGAVSCALWVTNRNMVRRATAYHGRS